MDSEGEVLEQRGSGMGGEVMQKGSELEKWGGEGTETGGFRGINGALSGVRECGVLWGGLRCVDLGWGWRNGF